MAKPEGHEHPEHETYTVTTNEGVVLTVTVNPGGNAKLSVPKEDKPDEPDAPVPAA